MGKKDVYSLQINQKNYQNYFKFFDYEENIIYKVQGYYDETKSQILCLYQTDNKIKYFIIDNMVSIYELGSFSHYIETYSYAEEAHYDLNNLITNPELSSLGYLNVERIIISYSYKDFGKDFYGTLMENNILIPEPSLNGKKIYNLSFINHIENAYTRIYHLYSVLITVQTCKQTCYSCWEEFSKCTDCTNENCAILEDDSKKCYPKDHLVKGYIYDSKKKKFLKCYSSCEFCSEVSSSSSDQKCTSCPSNYLYSYMALGNCYKYTGLEISEDKMVGTDNNDNEIFNIICMS